MAPAAQKTCIECGNALKGRADKKFCSDQCRSTYNNKLNTDETNYVRTVNYTLRRNRRILAELNPNGKTKVSGARLKEKGFDFQYFTAVYKTKDGAEYHYCYEYGYLALERNYYLLVVKPDFV
jgi:dipeptidase